MGSVVADFNYAVVDTEVGVSDQRIHDIGAIRSDGAVYHGNSKVELLEFLDHVDYVCGHNIIHHDAKYLFDQEEGRWVFVDTLYMSPLLFPDHPYHRLLKDDKLMTDQMNNPVNDCEKAKNLLFDEINSWNALDKDKRMVFASLLKGIKEFDGFLDVVGAEVAVDRLEGLIRSAFHGRICGNADLNMLIRQYPCELAYALALADTVDYRSVTPGWVLHNYPSVEYVMMLLCQTHCAEGCEFCNTKLDVHYNLKTIFGYDHFRTYEGEPLQENATRAAVQGKSLLAIFPTGGGKSLTFQLPALMAGHTVHGLTVVISPLQSLMKDQVDNLECRGITDAVYINGLLDPINRALSFQKVMNGDASILYIAPEMLRSNTVRKILLNRHVVRFVIDEAHCFSSWGQDFRVDYLYIGKFISEYQKDKGCKHPVQVSCFTATAKQKVIQDICDYFKKWLDLDLVLFASSASRTNLRYSVIHTETDEDKYFKLRELIADTDCPTIVYVSRTQRTRELSSKLTHDGYKALPFNGKMDSEEKVANQDAFMSDQVRIIVATSAFGMGVDKKDVGLVIHYDVSDSLENYVQEAGRAGRDPQLDARCYVLYCDTDLDKHFILLNQTKLSISEIQMVWKAVRNLTQRRMKVCCSALEIARQAGWDDSVSDIETRVRTALAALEQGGYIERGNNMPHVYATGITVKNVDEARKRITESPLFGKDEIENAVRIISSLISEKNTAKNRNAEAESRVDYLADILGLSKQDVVSVIERMRQEGILADSKDMSAFLQDTGGTSRRSMMIVDYFAKLERYILQMLSQKPLQTRYKQLNDYAVKNGIISSKEKDIRTILNFLSSKEYIRKKETADRHLTIMPLSDGEKMLARHEKRVSICHFTVDWLYQQLALTDPEKSKRIAVQFSIIELLYLFNRRQRSLFDTFSKAELPDMEEALLFLSYIGAIKLEGGFMVLYNAMAIRRLKESKLRYKKDDYRMLDEFYKQKIQQIHIVGEYANLMVKDYQAALRYVQDYFQMDYRLFVRKYFKGDRIKDIQRNLTPQKYNQLFGCLSQKQLQIIKNDESRCIVVAAGPGSGKTRVLVHKLASLLTLEDVKHEQLLMLTFSRAAATEFKQRLIGLIGNAAHFVEIKTFHSFCFDLLGRIGNLEDAKDVVGKAAKMISEGDVEPSRIAKTVLVVDEAQDMSECEYGLVRALMDKNEEMRVIAVGDDDQNIFEFRGSHSSFMQRIGQEVDGVFMEMTENFRSSHHVVDFSNAFVGRISQRMKQNPIVAVRDAEGCVEVVRHLSPNMYQPLAENLIRHLKNGSSCVLTQTNEEAVTLVALLRRNGVNCKLIQSMDGFAFCNLAEMRFFLKYIDRYSSGPKISDELWREAKSATFIKYKNSLALPYVKRCLAVFEQGNANKYRTDLWDFVFESSVEDFCDYSGDDVVVSTIHKAKGKEFDDVYMLVSGNYVMNDELIRRYYVGMTRAKNRLFIHTNSGCFDQLGADRYFVDQNLYELPEEIVLQLTHKDVYLDFFRNRKREVLSLRSGDPLIYKDTVLYDPSTNGAIAKLSANMLARLAEWNEKGYKIQSASVRFVVAWKPKETVENESETAVLLADIVLSRRKDRDSFQT